MHIKNLRLGTRLFLAFGLVSLIFGTAAVVGIMRLSDFKNEVQVLTENRLPKLQQATEWGAELMETARHTRNMLILDDKDKIQKEIDAVQEGREKRKQYMDALAATVDTPEEKEAFQAIIAARTAYLVPEEDYLKQIAAGQFKEAKDTLLTRTRPTQLAFADALKAYRVLEDKQIKSSADALSASYARSVSMLAVLLGIALAAAAVLGTLITRGIVKPLQEVLRHFDELRAGKFDGAIEVDSSDEPGQVLASLKSVQQSLAKNEQDAANAKGQIDAISRSQGVVEFNLDGTIITANENFLQLMGYALQEVKGQHHRMFVEPSERTSEGYRKIWDSLGRGEYLSGEFKRIGRGGREIWLQGSYNPIMGVDGRPYKVVKYANDVTSQAHLRAAQEKLQADQQRTKEELDSAVRDTQAAVQAAIDGELARRISMTGKSGQIEALAGSVNTLIDTMMSVVTEIKRAAGEVQSGAEEISAGNVNLSQRTEEQASSLEETAASMEEMTSTVKATAENATQARELAVAARQQADRGGSIVSSAVTAMSGINAASKKISDIIGVIDEIAFQTNLLALNAAVEAARAGDHGKGFAVVASEVRSLAGRSATAAKEIKTLINDSVTRVEEGSKLVSESGKALGDIGIAVKRVSDVITEIATASQEQASGIEQVNKAVMQMDETTQQNAALVEEAAAASESIVGQARQLATLVARYDVPAGAAAPSKSAAVRARPVARPPAAAAKAPAVERRSAKRPWSKSASPAVAHAGQGEAPPAHPAKSAAGDDEWKEF